MMNLTTIHPLMESGLGSYTVIIDPSGDAKRVGRSIGDSFERGLTLQCAEKIKELLQLHAPYITVVITRAPGDSVQPLQNASLSNRLKADLFVNLSFYSTDDIKPVVHLHQFSYGDNLIINNYGNGLCLMNYHEAYMINYRSTVMIGELFEKKLSEPACQSLFFIKPCLRAPVKQLMGIIAPAIIIEAGLKNKEWWHYYSMPIAESIIAAINALEVM